MHAESLKDAFDVKRKYNLRMNPERCALGIESGKFLGFMLSHRGIEANPDTNAKGLSWH